MLNYIILGEIPGTNLKYGLSTFLVFMLIVGLVSLNRLGTIPTPSSFYKLYKRIIFSKRYKIMNSRLALSVKMLENALKNFDNKTDQLEKKLVYTVNKYLAQVKHSGRIN